MSAPVSFPAKTSIPKQRSDVIQSNGNTGKMEKLKLMIEKLTKENKEYLKSNQHLIQNAKLVNQQNKILKDAINDRTLFYEQILDKYSRSIRTLQTATDNNKKMSKIYKEYKSKLSNSPKSNDDCIFNPEIDKIDREIKNIQIRANELIKKFNKSEMKIFNYRVLFSLDTKLDQINKIFINEAKNCISANPCFFSNSRLDKLQQKIIKGDEIKRELFEDKNEETKYVLKNISEEFDRCLSIYNQILLITKKRKLMSEDDLEGLSKKDGFSYEKVESKVQKNIGYDVEISELKKIVEHGGFDYLNDPEREENFKKIRSLFVPGFNSSIYKSTESTESYDSEKENNDEKLPDSSDESESEEEEELLRYDQKKKKYVSIKVDDSNSKKENVGKNSNVENKSQQKLKQIYLPIVPIFQQPIFKQNSPRIHLVKNTKQIETINQKENTRKEQSHEEINIKEDKTSKEENIKKEQSHEEINIKEESSSEEIKIEKEQSYEEDNIKEEKSSETENIKEEQSSEEINVEEEQSYEEEQSSESQLYSSDFDHKETKKPETAFECILNRQDNHSENSFLSGCLEISSSSEDPFYSSRTENEDQIILYQKSEDESDSLIEDDYLSERAILADKFRLSNEQNKKTSQDEKIEPLIPIIKTPFSFMFGPYKFEHSSEFVLEELDEQLEEELEKEKINIQLEELEKEKINIQLEELEKEEYYSKALEPPKLKVKKPNSLLIRPNKSRQRSFIKSNQKKPNEDSDYSLENSHENDLHSVTSSDIFVLSSSQQSTKSEEIIEPLIPRRKLEKSISFLYSKLSDEDDSNVEFILEEPESESEKPKEKQEIEEDNKNQDIIAPLKTNCIPKKKQKVSTYDPSIFYPTSTIYPRTKFDYFPRSNEKVPLTVSLKDIGLEGFDSCKIEKMKELQRLQKVRKEEQKIKSKSRIVVDERNHDKNYSLPTNSEVVCKLSIYGKSSSKRKEKISSLNRKKIEKIEPYPDSNHLPTSLLNSTQKAQKVHAIKPKTVPKTCSRINKSSSSVVDGNQLNSLVCRSPRRYNQVKND